MKRTSLSLILIFSLVGAPMPVQASNGMGEMMSLMMEMFLWMMRGANGGSGGFNRYNNLGSLGGIGNPMLTGSTWGYPSGWGNSLPYNAQGLYPGAGYPGSSANFNPYTSPYANPYHNRYTNPYNSPYRSPYNNSYSAPYASPYRGNVSGRQPYPGNDYNNPGYTGKYNRKESHGRSAGQAAAGDLPPNHASSSGQASANIPATTSEPNYQRPSSPQMNSMAPADTNYDSRKLPAGTDTSLLGPWQGVNRELLELGDRYFHLRTKDSDIQGTYELKNSIFKATIADRKEPVYMQYKMSDGHLIFRSEDGQLMLFRRRP